MSNNPNEYNIVIVDDEPIVTSNLKTLLKLEGFNKPEVFNNPADALEYVKKTKTDLVISDFFMPEMNGIEFLKEVRKIHSGATLVLLTGYADKESAINAINEIGLYRYIEKPWNNEDLLLCIRNGLERSHLIENLEKKLEELEIARTRLKAYNEKLEVLVKDRTQDLKQTNNKLSSIINYCADGIITISKNGSITQANPAFEVITGIESSINQNISELCISKDNIPIHTRLNSEKDVLIREYLIENKVLDKLIPVEISFAPIIADLEKGTEEYVGVIRDITNQFEVERLRNDFIATLTHDLRTPLLAAIQTLKFFIDGTLGELNDRQNQFLQTMLQSNQDMLGLVNALLEVYRYESGQLTLCRDNFVIKELIEQCIKEVQSLIEGRGLQVKVVNIPDEKIYADKHEIKRVIANFLGNAIKHTEKNGSITISMESKEEEFEISVEDTGIGIPEEDIPKLFNRFSQGTGKKRSTSTGLGLYLSRQIVEAHGGKIWLESEINKGSKFIFTIPRAEVAVY